jgi:hypothetical protein
MEIDAFDLFKVTLWRKSFTLHVKFLHWHNFGIFVLHLLDRSPITFLSFLNKIQTISEFRFAPSTVKDIRSETRLCHSHFSLAGFISFQNYHWPDLNLRSQLNIFNLNLYDLNSLGSLLCHYPSDYLFC